MGSRSKKDRTARLLRVEHLLYQNPKGLRPDEISKICGVSLRTTYRDFHALDEELRVPLWTDDDGRWGVEPGYHLPPIKFNVLEATALFFCARLALRYYDESDPYIQSAFVKLASAMRPPLSTHVQHAVKTMTTRTPDPAFTRVMEILAKAWADGCRVRIWYAKGGTGEPVERLVDPYFMEPSAIGHACYLIGFCHHSAAIRTFKVERIKEAESTGEKFALPEDFDPDEYLRSSWGIIADEQEVEVRLRFRPQAAARVKEARWHPSQHIADEPDGSLLFSVKVGGTTEIAPWILGWGSDVEVLGPDPLVQQVKDILRRQMAIYGTTHQEAAMF